MSPYIIIELDKIYELHVGFKLGIELFPGITVVEGIPEHIKQDPRKKIVLVDWWFYKGAEVIPIDLSWADLIVCYTSEVIFGPWETYYQQTTYKYNNKNIICITNGLVEMNQYPADLVFDDIGHFFSKISEDCYYEDWRIGPKSKIFDALLGVAKVNRSFIVSKLKEHNLLDSSFVNIWGDENYCSPELAYLNDAAINQNKLLIDNNSSMFPITGLCNGTSMSHSIPTEIYKQSWYSIVAETNASDSSFLTEKTAKPIFEKRLFVMFGSQGLLKKLHNQGYKTFSEVIDESYDAEPNNYKRWSMAFDQVLKLASSDPHLVYQQIESILEHNYIVACDIASRLLSLREFLTKHIHYILTK